MNKPLPANCITYIGDAEIKLRNVMDSVRQDIEALGGWQELEGNEIIWLISYDDERQLAAILTVLRDIGFLFQGHHSGWPPAEIFQYLRDRGLVQGNVEELLWNGQRFFTLTR